MRKTFRPIAVTTILALAALPAARAWEIDTFLGNTVGWSGDSAKVRYSAVSFPTGDRFTDALDTALLSRWNQNPSDFTFVIRRGDTSLGKGNFQNETWLENTSFLTLPGMDPIPLDPPAECWGWAAGAVFVEADVIFYLGDTTWNTSMNQYSLINYQGGGRPLEPTAMHEFGHFLGLNHENDEYNIMGEDWTHLHVNDREARSYYGEDGGDGAVEIYGVDSSAGQDVSVSHYEWSGRDGEYSEHNFTDLRDSSGSRLANSPSGPVWKVYEVTPGQTIQVEFTFENNGRSSQTREVGFYISTDEDIDPTTDDLFATKTPTQNRNSVYTRTYTLTLPSTLVPGTTRYLGAFIDHLDTLNEFDEDNNAAYFRIEVQ